jgi:uncharacterized protein YbjT (DUF2867 family)
MLKVLLLGATGLVGRHVTDLVLADDRFDQVVALTRRPLAPHPKLVNHVVDFDELPQHAAWWQVDGVICTLGTTRSQAGSAHAFMKVDRDIPLEVARLARGHGATRFALNSAVGANAGSQILYTRTKGELEQDIEALGFPSLTIVRPALIGGERTETRTMEHLAATVLGALGNLVPRRYRINPASNIARALVEGFVAGKPGQYIVGSEALV